MKKIWWPFGRYTKWGAKCQGKKDGKKNIPKWESAEQPSYLMELKQLGDAAVRDLINKWSKEDEKLKKKWAECEKEKNEALEAHEKAKNEYHAVEERYKKAHGITPIGIKPPGFVRYYLLIAILFICEFPMNSVVFRLFREAEIMTYIVTAGLAIALLMCAHYLGIRLREGKFQNKIEISINIMLIIVPMFTILAVAITREWYLSKLGVQTSNSHIMLFAFGTFNLIIFLAATIASYSVHDPLLCDFYRAKKQLEKARINLTKAEQKLASAKIKREKVFQAYRARAYIIKDRVQWLTDIYRTENLRYRTDRNEHENGQPKSFTEYVEVKIGKELEELDWDHD